MPVYEFACQDCGEVTELLLPLGRTDAQVCPRCGGTARHRVSRVGVRYGSWGFRATDSLVSDQRGKDFRALRERAERISDE